MIDLEDLSVRYFGRKTAVLDGVNLTFREGETVLLLGASGSGKSTLALTLNGLIPHALGAKLKGRISVMGLNTQETETAELAQKVGIVFQDPEAQFVTLKVEDEILFGLENLCRPPETMSAQVDQSLSQVKMEHVRQRPVDQLSGGQKQRIALAALLAMEPQVLVFDEPTANLDPVGTAEVFELLGQIKAQNHHTIILIEHKLDALMHLIDRVVVLGKQGHILADGTPQQVFYEYASILEEYGIWMPEICRLAHLWPDDSLLTKQPLLLDDVVPILQDHQPVLSETAVESADSQPIITISDLSFDYGGEPILNGINYTIPTGQFLAIVGANGAGKTTLAQHMAGILKPKSGSLLVDGIEASEISGRELARKIGYVFQNPEHQFITNTLFDEIAFGLKVMNQSEAVTQEQTEQLLSQFKLESYAKKSPFTLSHGEKRRLSVATMLAMGQDILVLDEPTFGQDYQNAVTIMQLLVELNQQGKTIIIITHDMHLVAEYTDHVAVMAGGEIIFDGRPRDLFGRAEILAAAQLQPPPIAQLSHKLAGHDEAWRGLCTVQDVIDSLMERS